MAESGLTTRFDETNPISPTMIYPDRLPVRPRSSILVASIERQVLLATATETAPSILWFATIQGVETKQDLADLAP
jgi:hypothetical protein